MGNKLKPITKKLRDSQRLKALQESKNLKEFGFKAAKIGSKGGKYLDRSASETGRQILENLATELLDKLEEGKVKFSNEVVKILKTAAKGNLNSKKFEQMKWAAEQGLKAGVLGGYAPTKTASVNLNISKTIDDPKLKKLEDEYNELIRERYLKGKEDAKD